MGAMLTVAAALCCQPPYFAPCGADDVEHRLNGACMGFRRHDGGCPSALEDDPQGGSLDRCVDATIFSAHYGRNQRGGCPGLNEGGNRLVVPCHFRTLAGFRETGKPW